MPPRSAQMSYFLAKTDPDTYSIDQFAAEHLTVWDGISNAQAIRAVRAMAPGDRIFIYHSAVSRGKTQPGIVGLASVASPPRDEPDNPKLAVVDFEFLRKLEPPTTLQEIKDSGLFSDWALVKQGRLSTMAVPDGFVKWMQARYPGLI